MRQCPISWDETDEFERDFIDSGSGTISGGSEDPTNQIFFVFPAWFLESLRRFRPTVPNRQTVRADTPGYTSHDWEKRLGFGYVIVRHPDVFKSGDVRLLSTVNKPKLDRDYRSQPTGH